MEVLLFVNIFLHLYQAYERERIKSERERIKKRTRIRTREKQKNIVKFVTYQPMQLPLSVASIVPVI